MSRQGRLASIRAASWADALLLAALLVASALGRRDWVRVLGPIHGAGFVVLVGLAADGAMRRWWGWWFPLVILGLAGPLGSFLGERRLR